MGERGREELIVHLDTAAAGAPVVVGRLARSGHGERADIAFTYEATWLAEATRFTLEPGLVLAPGEQRRSGGGLPAIFTDAAPDAWGRRLLERRELVEARREGRRVRALDEWDLLALVNDKTRMGALRFQRPPDPTFLSADPHAIPPEARLRDLEAAVDRLERNAPPVTEHDEWLARLIAPGASLGGARPKVTFERDDGPWIAKFPAPTDRRDVGAWEFVLAELASRSGIDVPAHDILALGHTHHTFASRRFDRPDGRRRLFASAMTLLDQRDHARGVSYLDIAAAIELYGSPSGDAIEADLEQLFRRAVFNAACGHRDDHLRNHGFLHDGTGWRLSPAFDQNPIPEKVEHELAFAEGVTFPDLDVIIGTARLYRLKPQRASAIAADVRAAVATWRDTATRAGLDRDERDAMASAFLV